MKIFDNNISESDDLFESTTKISKKVRKKLKKYIHEKYQLIDRMISKVSPIQILKNGLVNDDFFTHFTNIL